MNKALFLKEFRYGIGRLIAMPLLCIAAGYVLYLITSTPNERAPFAGLFSDIYQGATAVTCALIGLACGLWQALFETRPGPWAFLRHRPASASRIFIAKLLAALLMYIVIVGVPILGVIFWASRPGQLFGPWIWQMALPSLVDMLAGAVYVPAGLLIASRDARWFGSRILPLGLAICASICAFVPWAWLAPLLIIAGGLILLPAAWSSFINRGAERRQSRLAGLAVATTLLPAAIALPAFLAVTIEGAGELLTIQPTPQRGRYYQLIGGELYQVDYTSVLTAYRRVLDDQGQLLSDPPLVDEPKPTGGFIAPIQYAGFRDYVMHYRDPNRYLDMQPIEFAPEARRWFWMHEEKLIQEWTKPQFGRAQLRRYIGSNGAVTDRAQAVPFNPSLQTHHRQPLVLPVVEPQRVLQVDRATAGVTTLFTAPGSELLLTAYPYTSQMGQKTDAAEWIVVASDAAVYIVDKGQRVRFRRNHEPGYITVTISPSEDGQSYGLLYAPEDYWAGKQLFVRCDAQGNVLTRTELPRITSHWSHSGVLTYITQAAAVPPGVAASDAIHSCLYEKPKWRHALPLVFAVIGGIANWLLIRRDAVSRGLRVFWIIIGALGGFAGILLLLWMHTFPPRVRCQSCNQKRVVSRATCEHCGRPFPTPVTNGIGIFDSTRTTTFVATE